MKIGLVSRFSEVYKFREVLANMVSQHLKIKYRRTFFGYLWSLFNPILQLTVLTIVFSHVVKIQMKDYVLYLFSGLIVWNFISNCVQQGSWAILENEHFIKKIYLPKMIFPLARIILSTIDFASSLIALTIIGLFMGLHLPVTMLLLPFATIPLFAFCFGLLLLVSIGTVYFRDVQYLVTVFLQLFYFLTPIIYPIEMIPEKYQAVLRLNPIIYEIIPFQKLIHQAVLPSTTDWLMAYSVGGATLLLGMLVLFKCENDLVFRM